MDDSTPITTYHDEVTSYAAEPKDAQFKYPIGKYKTA